MARVKKILITGGEGFIGKNLKEYLAKNNKVFAPAHYELDLLNEDKVESFIVKNHIDIVIHCANVGGGRDSVFEKDIVLRNLRMFFSVVRNLHYLERVIQLGSGAEYDKRNYRPKMTERYFGVHIPVDDYGFSKYVCSKYTQLSDRIVVLRLFGVFGERENFYYKFISNAIVKNLLKMPILINQNVYFDFLYIKDLVRIIDYFINHRPKHRAYNVTRGRTIDLLTISKKINQISTFNSKIIVKHKGLNFEYSGSNKRLLLEIGKFQFTPFMKSLQELYAWYQSIIGQIDKKKIKKDEYLKYTSVRVS